VARIATGPQILSGPIGVPPVKIKKSDYGEYRKIFCEAERQLRVMLAKLRLSQAGFAVQWD